MSPRRTTSRKHRRLGGVALGMCISVLVACSGGGDSSGSATDATEAHRCTAVDGNETITPEGNAECAAEALGGDNNTSSAKADGDGSTATAVAGSLDLYDNPNAEDFRTSDDNTSLAVATHGGGALARSGVNDEGTAGPGGNTAMAQADRRGAFADASAANGNHNAATSVADGCLGAEGEACAFSAAGNGDDNVADALSQGEGSEAQAGALDGNRNKSLSAGRDGGRASSSAQGGDGNSANATATGARALAAAIGSGGNSFSLSRADGDESTANATAKDGALARAFAESGATATANATGVGFTAFAFASGAGTSASATHDADTDTGTCSGPGVAFAMTGGTFRCVQGF